MALQFLTGKHSASQTLVLEPGGAHISTSSWQQWGSTAQRVKQARGQSAPPHVLSGRAAQRSAASTPTCHQRSTTGYIPPTHTPDVNGVQWERGGAERDNWHYVFLCSSPESGSEFQPCTAATKRQESTFLPFSAVTGPHRGLFQGTNLVQESVRQHPTFTVDSADRGEGRRSRTSAAFVGALSGCGGRWAQTFTWFFSC